MAHTRWRTIGQSSETWGAQNWALISLKHKPADRCQPAYNVKKPRKAEVNFCPPFPVGETPDSLEREQLALLTEVRKRHNDQVVKEKMAFACRRQEVVKDKPMIAEFKIRWPGLFTVAEVWYASLLYNNQYFFVILYITMYQMTVWVVMAHRIDPS